MVRSLSLVAPLALCFVSASLLAAGRTPPPEYAAYVAAARKADAIADPLQRCLAYPDLPGNTWTPGTARARCVMFLTPPLFTLDALEQALAQQGGAASVDAKFRELLDAHFSVPDKREHIFTAFSVFRDQDSAKAERVARAWLATAPDSAFAHTALGRVLESRGWDARGGKLMRDTPQESVLRMETFFADAAKEYDTALRADPKLLPACEGLMGIGRQSSDQVASIGTGICTQADPASFWVVDEMMRGAEPRWGGSDAQMRAVAAYAQAHAAQNPVLAVFAFHHAFYPIDRAKDGDAEALDILEPAAKQVPNAGYMRAVGGSYLRKDEDWKAFVYLSQALRFSPSVAQESRYRAYLLRKLGESKWARADAERAVALAPESGLALRLLGDIVRETDGDAAAVPYFKRAMEDSQTREPAFNSWCGSLIDAKRRAEAATCVDELLAAYPDNGEGWRQRLVVIGFEAPGSVEAMRRFVELADAKKWPWHASAVENVRKVLAAKEGTASPADKFEARIMRAKALERTPEGRAYWLRLQSAFSDALLKAATCLDDAKPEDFTAVMDVLANGTLANVDVAPVNTRTSCFARRLGESMQGLPPPEPHAENGYPLVIEMVRRKP